MRPNPRISRAIPLAILLFLTVALPISAEVDTTPLPLVTTPTLTGVEWPLWKPEAEDGTLTPIRPILVTHAGDGSGRIFVPTQQGVIYAVRDTQEPQKANVFLDMSDKVVYSDKTNEEGFLGLAFHPDYAKNGHFYVYYTTTAEPHLSVISRFTVSRDDPQRADPNSEVEILRIKQPFWNHNGGTICFGPDGYLYVGLGDGGMANDPFGNGQKMTTLLGKILRIDVDNPSADAPYSIPADNPFVAASDGARPEIWALGLRNVWRMAFDPKTGQLWAADVGQDLWEEINLIQKGGNYGWNLREGMHPFGKNGVPPRKDLIEPIWEYHHDIGKSITGGLVYRGKELPELDGAYLYADYVSGKIWALWYDERTGQVTANREIEGQKLPILSFGDDEKGEVYLTTFAANGKGLLKITRK